MPVFEYKAVNSKGKQVRGVREADSIKVLTTMLRRESLYLTEAKEESGSGSGKKTAQRLGSTSGSGAGTREVNFKKMFTRVKLMDVAMITRQLATLLKAGIPLVDALDALANQMEKENLKKVLTQVKENVNEGTSLANAMSEHPKVFNRLYVNMVKAGESSGTLDVVLQRLAEFTSSQMKTRNKISSAMAYPAIMTLIGIGIVSFLFVYVIPKVTTILTDLEVSLPLVTRILIVFSDILGSFWWLVIIALVGIVLASRKYLASPDGREWWDRFKLKMPVFGSLNQMMAVSRFTRTLATLLTSGVPLIVSLEIVKNVLNNVIMMEAVNNAIIAIREGESIAAPLQRSGQFPPMVTHMIAVGERSGQLEEMLENVSDAYDNQVDSKLNALTSLLEPIMILFMGGMVAFIMFAVLLPVLKINESIQ